ncbi:PAS domain S-box protein [Sporomusa malonica]|uniref:histidine kinase n=1 Tax=Sporomusa malonica TaxID=112901 RepID=A0A1W2DK58_9FIRM|nr:PAS domain S-box protein [Sporomusa malonica]SMC97849.1 PAS domain S-box-containing protein [Sporomusa malonica]
MAELTSLHQVALKIMSQLDINNLLEDIVIRAMTTVGATDGFVDLFDDELQAMVTRTGVGAYSKLIGSTTNFTQGISGIVWSSGLTNVSNEEHNIDVNADWLAAKPKSAIGIPLKTGTKVTGVLGVGFFQESRHFTPAVIEWLNKFADLVSIALNNASLHTAVQKELLVRKWVEEALQTTQDRYRTLVDNIGVGVTLINRNMEIISTNTQLTKWFPNIDINKRPKCHQAFESRFEICENCPVSKTFHDGSINEKITTPVVDGVTKCYRVVSWPVMGRDGIVSEVIEMVEDISERRQTEEQLLKLSRAVDQSSSGVLITDVHGNIEYTNRKFSKITGYSSEEVSGKSTRLLKSGLVSEEIYKSLWNTVLAGKEWRGELYNRKKDGKLYWAWASISPIRSSSNEITHFVAIQEDITLRKKMEEEIKKTNLQLQETLDTLGRTQSQLIQQEKLAGIGQLAAGVAHEINNPLGFVISNFDTLAKYLDRIGDTLTVYRDWKSDMEKSSDPNIQDWVSKLDKTEKEKKVKLILEDLPDLIKESNNGLDRVSKIVKELRAFSRVDNQNNFEDYDVNAGIESTLLVARNEIKYWAEVEIELGNIPLIQAVGGAINQVFLNIFVNAAQAIKLKNTESLGLIRIKTYSDEKNIYCEITDSGIGIPADQVNKIFNPFFTTKPVGQGTGLGLSISYDIIITKHHGDINVTSRVGVGTTFTIKLPIKQVAHWSKEPE